MIKYIDIYDIDGVLVDSSRRFRWMADGGIDLDHWTEHRREAEFTDYLLPLAGQYAAQCADPEHIVIITTARQVSLDEYIWLSENLPVPYAVISRAAGDTRSSVQQKVSGLLPILAGLPLVPRYYYDDTPEVCYSVARLIGALPILVHSLQGGHR